MTGAEDQVGVINNIGREWFEDAPKMSMNDFTITDQRGYSYIGTKIAEAFPAQILLEQKVKSVE